VAHGRLDSEFDDFAAALKDSAVRDAPTDIDEAVVEGLFTGVVFALTNAAFEAAGAKLLANQTDTTGSLPPGLLVHVSCHVSTMCGQQ